MDWAEGLRLDIIEAASQYALAHSLPHYRSLNQKAGTVLFEPYNNGQQHGSFLDAIYQAILANPAWKQRLEKPHPRRGALPREKRVQAMELDSCTSSDALLMNIFCYPSIGDYNPSALLIGDGEIPLPEPEFGFQARIPLAGRGTDRTEVDMKLGNVLVEAKLTERDFTSKPAAHVMKYQNLRKVFHAEMLPQDNGEFLHYQLVRNILAADTHDAKFTLVCDARRPDLLRALWDVMTAIRLPELRARCGFLLWQEVASIVPPELCEFLRSKYGIEGPLREWKA